MGNLRLEKINQDEEILNQEIAVQVQCKSLSLNLLNCKILNLSTGTQVERDLLLTNVAVEQLNFNQVVLNSGMSIKDCAIDNLVCIHLNGNKRHLLVLDSNIKKAIIDVGTITQLSILGHNCNIDYLELSGVSEKDSVINIELVSIKHLTFVQLYNNGLIALRGLSTKADGKVSFRSSNFGKIDFISCDFSKGILEFQNCKITDAFLSETKFPKTVFVEGKENYRQAQLVFGQLAAAFQKQGDNIRALEYSSMDLEAHYKTVKWVWQQGAEKVSLWLHKMSSDFGRSWVYGVVFSFIVGCFFFCLLLISTDNYHWGSPSLDVNLLSAYLKFMNPLRFFELEHLFDNTPKKEAIKLSGLSYLADFGGRIFVAYGYYQTIQAFRRFGRK